MESASVLTGVTLSNSYGMIYDENYRKVLLVGLVMSEFWSGVELLAVGYSVNGTLTAFKYQEMVEHSLIPKLQ